MPPTFLGLHNLSQETQEIFRSSDFCPHQNLLTIELRALHNEFLAIVYAFLIYEARGQVYVKSPNVIGVAMLLVTIKEK